MVFRGVKYQKMILFLRLKT